MDDDEIFALIAAERRRAADMFEGLDDEQWSKPSLCGNWTVRDLAGHMILPFSVSMPRFILGIVTSGGFDRFNAKASRQVGQRPTAEIVGTLRDNAEHRFVAPGTGPFGPLTDVAVHTRDAARPLGLDTTAPLPTWRAALGFLTSKKAHSAFVPGGRRIAGLSFAATDQDWRSGDGPEVSGPSEAVALAMAGRPAALSGLTGEGVAVLAGRLAP